MAFPVPLTMVRGGGASFHGTAVSERGRALAFVGPSRSGKSGLAAQAVRLGAKLVADDLCLVARRGDAVVVSCPAGHEGRLELRGIGLVTVPAGAPAPLAGVWSIEASPARLPEDATVDVLGVPIPLLRHPASPDAAAKALVWLASDG